MQYTLTHAGYSIVISSLGAELQSFQKWSREYLYSKKEGFWQRQSPVLFPIVGALRDGKYIHDGREYVLSQHGFAREKEFELMQDTPDALTFQLVSDEQSREKYPFDFTLTITYILSDTGLRVEYSVKNIGNTSLLFSLGAHPAFSVENIDEYAIRFEGDKYSLLVDRLKKWLLAYSEEVPLENGQLPFAESLFEKDAMIFRELQSQKVIFEKNNQKILEFDRGNFPHFALWKQPNAPFLCLEPWQWYADSVDSSGIFSEKSGIVSLETGEEMDFWWGVRIIDSN